MWISKVRRSKDRERLAALLASGEKRIKSSFQKFLDSFENEAARLEIQRALDNGDIEAALSIVDQYIVNFTNVLPAVFVATATVETEVLAESFKNSAVAIGFDPTNERAANKMLEIRLNLIREFTEEQRSAVRQALTRNLDVSPQGPRNVARVFRDAIGLTARQEEAVYNYRATLERGSAQALQHGLRDRRYDRSVERAAASKEPLPADKIDQMVDRYRQNYLKYRSEVIARTEGARVVNAARQEAAVQVAEDSGIDPKRMVRIWNATNDSRTRDAHAAMDGQEVGMEGPFIDGNGNELMFPGDPSAPGETTIQCRCTFSVEIR